MVGVESDSTCTPHSPLLSLESLWDMIDYYVRMKNQIGCIKEQSEIGRISHHLSVSFRQVNNGSKIRVRIHSLIPLVFNRSSLQ